MQIYIPFLFFIINFEEKYEKMKLHYSILTACIAALGFGSLSAEKLVLLHTNDTHSQIDPADNGLGGILRRKAVIDSVRGVNPNVLLIDAGDAVQGTLYFTLYGGEVEMKAMNELGYDLAILGNHDFDNGIQALAENLRHSKATWITSNYDIKGSALEGLLQPYIIKEVAGKRIAFMGINLNPEGMISTRNYPGVTYNDAIKAANATAWTLRHHHLADVVVAITHIGYDDPSYPDDVELARNSEDIDIIIGGHSHTTINPVNGTVSHMVPNLNGKFVLVTQTGSRGVNIGEITIDLDSLPTTTDDTLSVEYKLIPVDSRLDNRLDKHTAEVISPYKSRVDSLFALKVAKSNVLLTKQRLANLFGDMVMKRGQELVGKKEHIDLGLINNGGIRNAMPEGDISEAHVMMTLPFDNRVRVIRVKGSDLEKTFNKMLERDINGVSGNVEIITDRSGKKCEKILIDNKPIDPDRDYMLSTIDYLADGGDYLVWLKNGETVATSPNILYKDINELLRSHRGKLDPPSLPRVHP